MPTVTITEQNPTAAPPRLTFTTRTVKLDDGSDLPAGSAVFVGRHQMVTGWELVPVLHLAKDRWVLVPILAIPADMRA